MNKKQKQKKLLVIVNQVKSLNREKNEESELEEENQVEEFFKNYKEIQKMINLQDALQRNGIKGNSFKPFFVNVLHIFAQATLSLKIQQKLQDVFFNDYRNPITIQLQSFLEQCNYVQKFTQFIVDQQKILDVKDKEKQKHFKTLFEILQIDYSFGADSVLMASGVLKQVEQSGKMSKKKRQQVQTEVQPITDANIRQQQYSQNYNNFQNYNFDNNISDTNKLNSTEEDFNKSQSDLMMLSYPSDKCPYKEQTSNGNKQKYQDSNDFSQQYANDNNVKSTIDAKKNIEVRMDVEPEVKNNNSPRKQSDMEINNGTGEKNELEKKTQIDLAIKSIQYILDCRDIYLKQQDLTVGILRRVAKMLQESLIM